MEQATGDSTGSQSLSPFDTPADRATIARIQPLPSQSLAVRLVVALASARNPSSIVEALKAIVDDGRAMPHVGGQAETENMMSFRVEFFHAGLQSHVIFALQKYAEDKTVAYWSARLIWKFCWFNENTPGADNNTVRFAFLRLGVADLLQRAIEIHFDQLDTLWSIFGCLHILVHHPEAHEFFDFALCIDYALKAIKTHSNDASVCAWSLLTVNNMVEVNDVSRESVVARLKANHGASVIALTMEKHPNDSQIQEKSRRLLKTFLI